MGTTNFNTFKAKMEQSKNKPKQLSLYNWMKLDAGKRYTLRFLPLKSENLELPISIYHHHALTFPDGHFESIACPKKLEQGDCPFCNQASVLYRKFTKTERVEFKEAAKKLFVKTHYLLVGYEPANVDTQNIKSEDLKIVRASSKANMELIEAKLQKEVDFVDFQTGRSVDLLKTKGSGKDAITNVTWDFNDPEPAFSGKNGKVLWDDLVDKSPDLTLLVQPLVYDKLMEKFTEFMSAPVETSSDEEERSVLSSPAPSINAPSTNQSKQASSDDLPFDLEDMRKALNED